MNSINRNILECKCRCVSPFFLMSCCINRNILECKFSTRQAVCQLPFVLIETYWNVNVLSAGGSGAQTGVLIETYWNVNAYASEAADGVASINRNILECK